MKVRNMRGLVAVVLALLLTLTMMPVAFAGTLQDQIDEGTATITLEADTTECISIPAGKTVTLKLNGHALSNGGTGDTISNYGTLIIEGPGTIEGTGTGYGAIVNYPDGSVTIHGGLITGKGWYAIKNMGVMEIHSGTTVEFMDGYNASSLIANGWYDSSSPSTHDRNTPAQSGKAKLTIYGGTFTGGTVNVKNDDYGELIIKGGTFGGASEAAIQNWNVATIEGGDFTNEGYVLVNGGLSGGADQGILTITGGTFTSESQANIFKNAGAAKGIGMLSVEGGTFIGKMPQTQSATTYELVISGGEFTDEITDEIRAEGAAYAAITSGGETVYVVGAEKIAEKVAALQPGDEAEVKQGITELSNVPAGVKVENATEAPITVNGSAVENGGELVIPEPVQPSEPQDTPDNGGQSSAPHYYPDYDEQPAAPAQPSQSAAQQYAVTCRKLNVRAGASTAADRIGTLSRGAVIEGVAENGWVRFTTDDGRTGYVSAAYLCALDDDSQVLAVVCRKLNVRAGAGTGFAKVGSLSRGQTVEVLGAADGWYRIAYGADTAWVCAKYVG